jgi:hypothetical protein
MRLIRSRFTSAHLIALLALFVALGGSAYAIHLGKNAVKTKNIKSAAVTADKLAPGAVTAAKLAPGAVTATALGSVVVRTDTKPLNDSTNAIPQARCHPGERAVGGGGVVPAGGNDIAFNALRPLQATGANAGDGDEPGAFYAEFTNATGGVGATVAIAYVLCIK